MSKSDDALAAAQEVREQAFLTGTPAAKLIAEVAPEWDVAAHVVESWLLRDPTFDSLESLDHAVAAYHQEAAEHETRRSKCERERDLKFQGLSQIIDAIPAKGVLFAMLKVVGSTSSQAWRTWIRENCGESETERDEAFAFATIRMRTRLNDEKSTNAQNN